MPDLATLSFVAGATVLGYIVSQLLFRAVLSPLRSVPGPFLARWTDIYYLWHVAKGRWEVENVELHRINGPIVRYGPTRYSFDDPEAIATIYGHGTRFTKSSWYEAWALTGRGNIFADRSVPRHANTRRQLQSTYSMTSLVSYEPYVDVCSDVFSQRLAEMSEADAGADGVDMGHWLQCYAFDVIGQITFGRPIGFLDRGADIQGIMRAIESGLVYSTLMGIYARLHRLGFAVFNFFAEKEGGGQYIMGLAKTRIAEEQGRREADGGEKAAAAAAGAAEPFLSKFLTKYEQDPEKFSMQHVLEGCMANISAGSDTTGITLSAILYYLIKHPECMRKLREEVADFQERGLLCASSPSSFAFQETQQMPYLQAVIKETLRVHPATGLPLERVVPEGGATISGRFFPSGTIVGVNAWVAHRNTQIFGADADEYNPERWLISDKDKLAKMNRQWIPFGVGSRTCIGRHISTLEINKLIPRIVRDFDFEIVGGKVDSVWTTRNFWFVKPKGFRVKVTRHKG